MKIYRVAPLVLALLMVACGKAPAQNGPTQPETVLSWSNVSGVTATCVYRCAGTGCTPGPPALACSLTGSSTSPFTPTGCTVCTGYGDLTVSPSTNYAYAITDKVGTAETAYSNSKPANIPSALNGPVQNDTTVVAKNDRAKGTVEAKNVRSHRGGANDATAYPPYDLEARVAWVQKGVSKGGQ